MLSSTEDGFQLRPATNADAEAIRRVVFGVLHEYGLPPDPDGLDADLAEPETSYHRAGGSFDVLTDSSGVVVGTVGLFPLGGARCELRKMYLAARCRGRGLGKRLLRRALARARELGFTRIELETASILEAAARLYESFGFVPCAPHQVTARVDRAYYLDLAANDPAGEGPCER
jgi:putative acetyltransferase